MQFYRMSRYQKNKIKIKSSMTTSNYKLDIRYALVDTDIIDNKKNIIYTEAIIATVQLLLKRYYA